MVKVIDDFFAVIQPYIGTSLDVVWQIIQLVGLLALIAYAYMLYMYDTKVNIREYSKGGRLITYTTRARKVKNKKTGTPKLKFFGKFGFGGDETHEPPAECLVAHRSRITTKMYDFVKKDGLYFPIENFVLGTKQLHKNSKGENEWVYSIEGSGLEISRDFDAEQSIQNKLIEEANQFRNKKPTEIIASYALMIITIITSGVVMWFAWKQFGNMAGAIASLNEPLKQGIAQAAQNIIGPG